jgi:hypothetical protein
MARVIFSKSNFKTGNIYPSIKISPYISQYTTSKPAKRSILESLQCIPANRVIASATFCTFSRRRLIKGEVVSSRKFVGFA